MKSLFFLTLLFLLPIKVCGQSLDTLKGVIKDSEGNPLPGANVWVYLGTDTLHYVSNEYGKVEFPIKSSGAISIRVSSLAYEDSKLLIVAGQSYFELTMKEKLNLLKEIVVKGIINPVTIKEDTLEYDVKYFIQSKSDVIQDLLTRLPGLQVNSDGSISIMGQKVSKIRINGQEIMLDDISSLTKIIPADLINKIQLIDDYGENSRLTGRKTSGSKKIINLTTANNIGNFYVGRLMIAKGSDNLYSLYSNLFKFSDQQSINFLAFKDNISKNIGKANNALGELSFRNNFNKKLLFNSNFGYKENSGNLESKSILETTTSEGVLYNDISSNGGKLNKNIFSGIEIAYNPDGRNQVNFHFNENLQNNNANNEVTNFQNGFQKKDQFVESKTNSKTNEYEGDLLLSHKFNDNGRIILLQLNLKNKDEKSNFYINNKLRFYSYNTGLYSDSVLNQIIFMSSRSDNIKSDFSYIEPLSKNSSLEFNYSYLGTRIKNMQTTNWMNGDGKFVPVDSLKNDIDFNINQHQVEINLQIKKGRFEYIIGSSLRPYLLHGNKYTSGLHFFPVFQLSYNKENTSSFKIKYSGETIFPTFQQLSLVPDYTDIQNPIYGNPYLKAAQRHNISFDLFKNIKLSTLIFKITGTILQKNITSDIYLVEDVLGTLKQETHFLNTDGNYVIDNTNLWVRHLMNNKGSYEIQLGSGFSQNVLYYNNLKYLNQNLKLTSKFGISYKPSIYFFSLNAVYTFSKSSFSINDNSILTHTININNYSILSLNENLKSELVVSKQFNWGFGSGLNYNPLMLDVRINKWLLKRKLIIVLECNNILNESSQITQSTSNNAIAASFLKNRGRYFLLKFMFDFNILKKAN
jgi:hypothetical protein